jgi:hypothetical protein
MQDEFRCGVIRSALTRRLARLPAAKLQSTVAQSDSVLELAAVIVT